MRSTIKLSCEKMFIAFAALLLTIFIGCKRPSELIPETEPEPENIISASGGGKWGCSNHIVDNDIEAPAVKLSTTSGGSFNAGNVNITWSWTGTATSALLTTYAAAFNSVNDAALDHGVSGSPSLSVEVKRYTNMAAIKLAFAHLDTTNFPNRPHGYLIETSSGTPNKVTIHAITEPGILNALGTLESRIQHNSGVQYRGLITDWPDLKWRGLHLVIKNITTDVAKAAIDRMRRAHYNLIVISISNNVNFQTLVDQGLASDCAWSTTEFMSVVNHAKESGMTVIPELRLLSHQQDFMSPVIPGPFGSLMWPDGSEKTYNPDSATVYTDFVYPYIDDVVSIMNPATIHIGHDEVYGIHGNETPASNTLPGEKFMDDVIAVNNYIKSKGKSTMMWGDMMMKPAEFPDMHPGSLNGNSDYVGERGDLPSDIAICDWHYREKNPQGDAETFPSMLMYANTNEVYGATFDTYNVVREFARYTADNYANTNVKGMIATTWARIILASTNNPNATDDWVAFDNILAQSGAAFWNKPDAP